MKSEKQTQHEHTKLHNYSDPGLCVNWVNDNCNIPEAHQTIHEDTELSNKAK